jgi:hypothetical protein
MCSVTQWKIVPSIPLLLNLYSFTHTQENWSSSCANYHESRKSSAGLSAGLQVRIVKYGQEFFPLRSKPRLLLLKDARNSQMFNKVIWISRLPESFQIRWKMYRIRAWISVLPYVLCSAHCSNLYETSLSSAALCRQLQRQI